MALKRITVTYNKKDLEGIQRRVKEVMSEGVEIIEQAARRLAPYDPESKHAAGKTKYPNVHHRDTLRGGKAKDKNESSHGETFAVDDNWGGTWFVRSGSGRGYWLEKGTKSNERRFHRERETYSKRMDVIGKYGLTPDKGTKKQMSKGEKRLLTNAIKSLKTTGEVVKFKDAKLHAATPAQPHIMPAFEIAKMYIIRKLKDIA